MRSSRLKTRLKPSGTFLNKPVDIHDLTLRVGNAVYTKHLFDQLWAERDKSERLLLNTLPRPIAERMKTGELNIADRHQDVTVLLADIVGFTAMTAHNDSDQIISLLNEIFSTFDQLAKEHGLEKIKTIANLALDMRAAVEDFNRQYRTSMYVRIGICTGPVVAGVIGRKKFAYDIWGDTVNLACRLESAGEPGMLQVSESSFERLSNRYRFEVSQVLELKGHGRTRVHRLTSR